MRATLLLTLSLVAAGCGSTQYAAGDALTVSERHGRMFVGEVALDHKREVVLEGRLEAGRWLSLGSAGGPIEISGAPGEGYRLIVELYSEFEDDGDVELEDGRLVAEAGRGRTLVHAVRGSVPERIHADLSSGTGDITVRTLLGDGHLRLAAGTGVLRVAECELDSLQVDTGVGDLALEGSVVDDMSVQSGTAEIVAVESAVGHLEVVTGTGNVRLRRCKLDELDVSSGTGDLLLIDTTMANLRSSLGTGEVVYKVAAED